MTPNSGINDVGTKWVKMMFDKSLLGIKSWKLKSKVTNIYTGKVMCSQGWFTHLRKSSELEKNGTEKGNSFCFFSVKHNTM